MRLDAGDRPGVGSVTPQGVHEPGLGHHTVRVAGEYGEHSALLWRSEVVTAFHLVPAAELEKLDEKMESDVVACGNDDDARHTLMEIISAIPDLRAFDGGSLENAVGMETFAAVLLTINIRHKMRASLRLTSV